MRRFARPVNSPPTRAAARALRCALAIAVLAGCDEGAPAPSFEPVFPPVEGELMSNSSPAVMDLDGDGVADIVFGTGTDRLQPQSGGGFGFSTEPEVPGYVTAVSGASNAVLWKAPHAGEAFTTPRFAELNGDGVPDVVMGGREGAFAAFSGVDGARLWRAVPSDVVQRDVPFNFFTPAVIDDVNGDGAPELVVIYGGDDTRRPEEPRAAGWIVVVSGADGGVLAAYATPDGRESYSSVLAYERADGSGWVVFGTGGEAHGGAAWRAPVAALLDGTFAARVERLIPPGEKGAIAPATLADLSGDGELDIVISTFDGRLFVIDGATGDPIWERHDPGEETYHPAAVMRVSRDGRPGLLVSRAIGVFPEYAGTVHRIFAAGDGQVLYEHRNPLYPAGAPLAVDLTGDGIDEPFFFSARGRINILHGRSGKLIAYDVPAHFAATPLIADLRGTGTLELIGVAWDNAADGQGGVAYWRDLTSRLLRLDLDAPTPEVRSWAGYMGTAADGRYPPTAAAAGR